MTEPGRGHGHGSGYGHGHGPGYGRGHRPLDVRFGSHMEASGWLDGATAVVAGVSGGVDSMVLLHLLRLLRFDRLQGAVSLHVAHVDHRMRPRSEEDAAWVAKICADWEVDFHLHTAARPVTGEAEGRDLRYAFFEEIRRGLGDGAVTMTAHTADDQAETVLFRIARGSGPRGLGAVHPARPPHIVRPLLPFWRRELLAHAAEHGVPYRDDPSNLDTRWTRNRLRHTVLPLLEEAVPGAAAALAALADTSRLHSAALDELLDERIAALSTAAPSPLSTTAPAPPSHTVPPTLSLDRAALLALPDPVLVVLLRRAVAHLGSEPSRAATAQLLRFVRESPSGRRLHPTGGVAVEHRLGEIRIRRAHNPSPPSPTSPTSPPSPPSPRPFSAPAAAIRIGSEPGQGAYAHGGWVVDAAWGPEPRMGFPHVAHFARDRVSFPLSLRPWAPGDRMTMPYGRKKVKKLLLEARMPADLRAGVPVVADADGAVRWIPGIAGPPRAAPKVGGESPQWCLEVNISRGIPQHSDGGGPV